MRFEWDPEKNKRNVSKHRIDFKEAETAFEDPRAIEIFDDKHSQNENRFILIGMSTKERELTVCYCERNGGSIIRIFSARKATKNEKEMYERGF